MESGIKSSFIPSDAAKPQALRKVSRTGFADLLILLAVVGLVASIALAAGVFLYLQYLQTNSASKLEQLNRAKEAFEPSLIQELTRLDDRMRAAEVVLKNHTAPTLFFRLLEQLTLQTVSYASLDFNAADSQNVTIKMDGVAASVNSIALQADYLSRSGTIASPIFSNVNRGQGGINFNLSAIINPVALRYSEGVAAGAQQVQQVAPTQQQPVSPFGEGAASEPEGDSLPEIEPTL